MRARGLLYRDLRDKVYYTVNIHALLLLFGQLARRNTNRNGEEFIQTCLIFRCSFLPAATGYEVIIDLFSFSYFTTTGRLTGVK
jgi:hypothetical protein